MKPFSRSWWAFVLVLASVGGVVAYDRWADPHPYPWLVIAAGAISIVALATAAATIERRRSQRD